MACWSPISPYTWPLGPSAPVSTAFLRRNSTGSMPIARATSSVWLSTAQQVCGAVGARTEPDGWWLVYTRWASASTLGIWYGPSECMAAICGKKPLSAV